MTKIMGLSTTANRRRQVHVRHLRQPELDRAQLGHAREDHDAKRQQRHRARRRQGTCWPSRPRASSPNRLQPTMKKNIVNKYGRNRSAS